MTLMKDFPHQQLMTMAALDTICFSGLVISASGVTPTMTLILLHASTPVMVWGSMYVFPNRVYSPIQGRGAIFIGVAIIVSLVGAIIFCLTQGHVYYIMSALTYVSASILQGFSTLYKEKCIVSFARPMDEHFMSTWLFMYQTVFTALLSPILYIFQGVTSHFGAFPMDTFFENISNSLSCLQGKNVYSGDYNNYNSGCGGSIYLILLYVVSNLVISACLGRVLQHNSTILGRVLAASVFFAFIALAVYDHFTDFGSGGLFGGTITWIDIVSLVLLLAGMEIYGSDPEPDVELVANNYSTVLVDQSKKSEDAAETSTCC